MKLRLQSERKKIIFLWHKSNSDKDAVQVHSQKVFKEETFCIVHISQLTLHQYLRPFIC